MDSSSPEAQRQRRRERMLAHISASFARLGISGNDTGSSVTPNALNQQDSAPAVGTGVDISIRFYETANQSPARPSASTLHSPAIAPPVPVSPSPNISAPLSHTSSTPSASPARRQVPHEPPPQYSAALAAPAPAPATAPAATYSAAPTAPAPVPANAPAPTPRSRLFGVMMDPPRVKPSNAGAYKSWYWVTKGRATGVFYNWSIVRELVDGLNKACYRGESTWEAAVQIYSEAWELGVVEIL